MTQAALPFTATIQETFEAFHAKYPQVYAKIVAMARTMKRRGFEHYGIKALVEVVRWHMALKTGEEFKINNNYTSRYSRLIMQQEPDLAGFFDTRETRAA